MNTLSQTLVSRKGGQNFNEKYEIFIFSFSDKQSCFSEIEELCLNLKNGHKQWILHFLTSILKL